MKTDILKKITTRPAGILCLIVVILALALPSKAGAGDVIDTVSVGDGPYGVAITPNGSYVYVTNSYDDTVSVIQTSDNSVIDSISVGDSPQGISTSPNGEDVYVTNFADGTVSVIRAPDAPTLYVSISGDCGDKTPCYHSIQEAIDAAGSKSFILIAHGTYNESIVLNESKALALQGGWDAAFTSQISYTKIKSMRISDGTVRTEYLVIR